MTFQELIPHVLQSEGGYVFDPLDRGGETRYGISKRAFPQENIQTLTKERATELYRRHYWEPIKGDQLPTWLRYTVFDFAVNAGVRRAIEMLQRLAGVKVDGVLGPKTLEAARTVSLKEYTDMRKAYYEGLVRQNPTQRRFLNGWLARNAHVHNKSLRMTKDILA
jgi:lysozyme family protein